MLTNKLIFILVLLLASAEDDITIEEAEQIIEKSLRSKPRRVKFNRGATGVIKDDVILSDAQNDWLFGGNEEWEERDHATYNEPNRNSTNFPKDPTFDANFWNNTGDYLNSVDTTDLPVYRRKRAGFQLRQGVKIWHNGIIPYFINPQHFNEEEKQQIREAMDVYEKFTCLRFVMRTNERQWINIHHTEDGCYSLLGDASAYNPGPQPLSLQQNGCRHFGTYLHELGHAIGLVHEHQLPTRAQYIRYYAANVDPNMMSQLEMYNMRVINTFNTPYDLGSIMHYEVTAFSYDDMSPTLGVDNPWLEQHIGRRYSNILSFGDVKTINELYQCDRGCKTRCPEALGYVDRKCKCIGYEDYTSRTCKNEEGLDDFCNKMTPQGKCDIRNIDHHKACAKTCGFCPRFKPGQSAIGPQQVILGRHKCLNRYHEPTKCQQWAGLCSVSPWMHRYCRATCQACQSEWGDCPNTDPDFICDRRRKHRQCGTKMDDRNPNEFMRVRCADSCGSCGIRNKDLSCRNELPDGQCDQQALEHGCERNPIQMFQKCRSTCNRCYWNKGSCKNRSSDKVCLEFALQNMCVAGEKVMELKKICARTCGSC